MVLASRPAPLENLFARFNLQAHASSPAVNGTSGPSNWPPAHLAEPNKNMFEHPKIHDRLAGINWQNKGPMPTLPTESTNPFALRRFVA